MDIYIIHIKWTNKWKCKCKQSTFASNDEGQTSEFEIILSFFLMRMNLRLYLIHEYIRWDKFCDY